MALITLVFVAMAFLRTPNLLMIYALLAGVAWTLVGTELWLVAQRVISGSMRGRMNALLIMVGQGGIALGSILLGMGAAKAGLHLTLVAAAVLACIVLGLGYRLSINFEDRESVETPATPPEEMTQDEVEAIGYYITSLSRISGYSKDVELRNRTHPAMVDEEQRSL